MSAAWGFGEATLFFVVPDVVLSWACLAGPRAALRSLAAIVAGSLIGGALVFALGSWRPEATHAVISAVPFVSPAMFDAVATDYRMHGAAGLLFGPASGIPYKVYASTAPAYFGPLTFLILSVPARLERLALTAVVGLAVERLLRRRIAARPRAALAALAAFWGLVYAAYWGFR